MMQTKVLIRTPNYQTRYQQWKNESLNSILQDINQCYSDELILGHSYEVIIVKSEAQVVLILNNENYSIDDLSFLSTYFKDLLLQNQYYVYMSDERIETQRDGLIQNIHRHYLKPDIEYSKSLDIGANLMFGNIIMEHYFNKIDNKLIVTINYYSQKKYHSFEKLMELLLKY
ncbi:MAG: hypothetical protein Q8K70_07225 [Bacteroidota bacterium]|nr:hypothetical protein [Bacteroidota bacterium]